MYAYDSGGKILGEVNALNDYNLSWTVDVANIKAASHVFRYMHPTRKVHTSAEYTLFRSGRFTNPQPAALRNPDIQSDAVGVTPWPSCRCAHSSAAFHL